jgi:putative (di)nucleoside polyphosphate hydrolase
MSDVIDRDGFRANVGIVLMDRAGQLFLGRRAGGKGWQFPQGGMLHGESAEESLYRELREETSTRTCSCWAAPKLAVLRLPARYVRRDRQPSASGKRWFLLRRPATSRHPLT